MLFRRKKRAEPEAAGVPASPPPEDPTTQFLTGEARLDRRSVQVLLDAIARVSESRDLDSLLDYIVDTSIDVTGAERGLLILTGPGDELVLRVARERGKKPLAGEARFSTSIVKRVLGEEEPMRATVTSDSEALELGTSVFDLKLRAVMCVPLIPRRRDADGTAERGALYVDSRAATREFSHEDLALFAALSQHVQIALENTRLHLASVEKVRLEQSLEIASAIQSGLMPRVPADLPGYDVHGWYKPAERTSGDFYDFVRLAPERLAVVVGDVTGHGIGPALITASAQASLRSYLRVLGDPGPVLRMLGTDLEERMETGMFITLFLALLEPGGKVRWVNAGHAPPLVWRAAGREFESLRGDAPALGMLPGFEYLEGPPLRLALGDVLVAFSDGFVEARSKDAPETFFDESGLRHTLEEHAGADARGLVEALVEATLAFAGGAREDDMTVVAVRRTA
jgi:serine phosphatase RsbU (regulator of sigma subunit)